MTVGIEEVWLHGIFVLEFEQAHLSLYKWVYALNFSHLFTFIWEEGFLFPKIPRSLLVVVPSPALKERSQSS